MKNKKIFWIIVIAAVALLIIQPGGIMNTADNVDSLVKKVSGGGSVPTQAVVNKGVSMKAFIGDENGNPINDLMPGEMPQAFSVLSYEAPTGFSAISPASCSSGCSFLYITTALDNRAGDSEITATSVTGDTTCHEGNSLPECSSIPNVLGAATIANTRRGNLNSKYSTITPITLAKGEMTSPIITDPIALDEASLGLIDLKINVAGTFVDSYGDTQPLASSGSITLRAAPSVCLDGTTVDPTVANDEVAYCSSITQGKYCRVGADGVATLTDKASLCGCPAGQTILGETCKMSSCVPNSCVAGTINYCKADGESYESRCSDCGYSNCPLDTYGNPAVGCVGVSTNSLCSYPGVAGSGFLVSLAMPEIGTVPSCGDGIKSGTEQCDISDFGGKSCTDPEVGVFNSGTLVCNPDCTYNTNSCVAGKVRFRTYDLTYSVGNAVAYNSGTCGNSLKAYGRTTALCSTRPCSGTASLIIPTSTGTTKLFVLTSSVVCICDPGVVDSTYSVRYTTSSSDAYKVSTSVTSIAPSKEVICT